MPELIKEPILKEATTSIRNYTVKTVIEGEEPKFNLTETIVRENVIVMKSQLVQEANILVERLKTIPIQIEQLNVEINALQARLDEINGLLDQIGEDEMEV